MKKKENELYRKTRMPIVAMAIVIFYIIFRYEFDNLTEKLIMYPVFALMTYIISSLTPSISQKIINKLKSTNHKVLYYLVLLPIILFFVFAAIIVILYFLIPITLGTVLLGMIIIIPIIVSFIISVYFQPLLFLLFEKIEANKGE